MCRQCTMSLHFIICGMYAELLLYINRTLQRWVAHQIDQCSYSERPDAIIPHHNSWGNAIAGKLELNILHSWEEDRTRHEYVSDDVDVPTLIQDVMQSGSGVIDDVTWDSNNIVVHILRPLQAALVTNVYFIAFIVKEWPKKPNCAQIFVTKTCCFSLF